MFIYIELNILPKLNGKDKKEQYIRHKYTK